MWGIILINKKIVVLSIFLIALLSLSVVSAEECITDLDDSGGDIVSLDNVEESSLSTGDCEDSSDIDLESIDCEDSSDIDLEATDVSDLETSADVEINNVEVKEDGIGDVAQPLNTKSKNLLKSSYDEDVYYAYVDPLTTYYVSGKNIYFGWLGYFSGYFKIYKGSSVVYSEYLYGYDDDSKYCIDDLGAGTYYAKLIDDYYGVLDSSKVVIKKATTKISVKSFTTTAGIRFHCYAYVKDKRDGANINGGYVKFKIAGKTYKAKLKNGVASFYFKVPKKAKKYICKAIFPSGKNIAGSSTKFKMVVKKKVKPKYKILTIKVRKDRYISKKWRKFRGETYYFKNPSASTLCMFLYKNGKMVDGSYYLTKFHYKYKGKWHWTSWRGSYGEAVYHKTAGILNSVKINKVKIKFRYK